MPLDFEITRADGPDDPERCQGITTHGQCTNKAVHGSKFCAAHGGNKAVEATAKDSLRGYQLTKWRAKLLQFNDDPKIKSLRDDIGILRMLIETLLNKCDNENDLVLNSGRIADLITRVEKVVSSCQRLEDRMGDHLDKAAALRLGQEIAQIITEQVNEVKTEILESGTENLDNIFEEFFTDPISTKLTDAITRARGNSLNVD